MKKRTLLNIVLMVCVLMLTELSTITGVYAADRDANIAIDTKFGTIEIRLLPYVTKGAGLLACAMELGPKRTAWAATWGVGR